MKKLLAVLILTLIPSLSNAAPGKDCHAAITLQDYQIRSLPTTPLQLVAAQGSTRIIIPTFATLYLNWVNDFSNVDAGASLRLTDGNGFSLMTEILEYPFAEVSSLLGNGDNMLSFLSPFSNIDPSGPRMVSQQFFSNSFIGQPLQIRGYNVFAGDFVGGDGSTLVIGVDYHILDVTTGSLVSCP